MVLDVQRSTQVEEKAREAGIATFNGPSRVHGPLSSPPGRGLLWLFCGVGRLPTSPTTIMSLHASVDSPSTASIRVWLNRVPPPQPTTIGRKRKLCKDETDGRKFKRRAPLHNRSPNIVAWNDAGDMMWRRETRSSKQTPLYPGASRYDATLRDPSGGRAAQDDDGGPVYGGAQHELDDQGRLAQSEDDGTALDPDRTPRSIPQAPSMPPPKTPSSRSSNRSESPDKMAGLRNIKGGLDYVMMDIDEILANEEHALHELADVLDRLEAFSRGVGVIPPDMLKIRQDPRVHRELRYDYPFDPSTQRAALGQAPDISNVVRLSTSTEVCQVEQEPEPAWNCAVHWPLAQLALDLSIHADNVLLKNM